MPVLLLAVLLTQSPTYSERLRDSLAAAAVQKLLKPDFRLYRSTGKAGAAVALELDIAATGAVTRLGLAHSSGDNGIDDASRRFVLAAEPLPPPPAALACLVRLRLVAVPKIAADPAVACFSASELPELAGEAAGEDPPAQLFAGWRAEAAGQSDAALARYGAAAKGAPTWDLAGRALGLALVKAKRVEEALPHLSLYVTARAAPEDVTTLGRELERYQKFKEKQKAEESRVRDRLSKADITGGIKKGYALLEPCLKRAREARALAVGVDTLVLSWTVQKDGTVKSAHLDAPTQLLMTDHAECIEAAVTTWVFPKFSEGSDLSPRGVPIRVRGSPEAAVAAASPGSGAASAAPPAAALAEEEPSFSTCSRSEAEIGGYIKKSFLALNRCVKEERRRMPNAPMPEQLPVSFVIDTDGSIRGVGVRHRHFRDGPMQSCIAAALAGSLAPTDGVDCPAEFSLDLRGL